MVAYCFRIHLVVFSLIASFSLANTKIWKRSKRDDHFGKAAPLCADSRCHCKTSGNPEENGSSAEEDSIRGGYSRDSGQRLHPVVTAVCHVRNLDDDFNQLLNNSTSVRILILSPMKGSVQDTQSNFKGQQLRNEQLTLPWKVVVRKPSLQVLDLSSIQLSCDCENSWLAFWPNLSEPLVSADTLKSLTTRRRRRSSAPTWKVPGYRYLHVINEEPSCPYNCSLTVTELFHLPRRIVLSSSNHSFGSDPFAHCLKNQETTAHAYFAKKCGLGRLAFDQEKVIINETNPISVRCSRSPILEESRASDIPWSSSTCPSLKLAPFMSPSYSRTKEDGGNETVEISEHQRWPLETSCSNMHVTIGEKLKSSRNESGWLLCQEHNRYLPQAALAPFIVAGPPQILNFDAEDFPTPEQVHLFYVVGYPRPQFGWYNRDEEKWPKPNSTKGFEVILSSKPSFGHYIINGRVTFSELSMNCFKGSYDFIVCNNYGCDKRNFNITQGMPAVMCPPSNVLPSPDTSTVDTKSGLIPPHWPTGDEKSSNQSPQNGSRSIEKQSTTKRGSSNHDSSLSPTHNKDHENWIYIAVPFLVVFAVVLVGVLTTCLFLRLIGGSTNGRHTFTKSSSSCKTRPSLSDWEMSPLNQQQLPSLEVNSFYVDWLHNIKTHVRVFPAGELTIIKELGEGAFGRVFLAKFSDATASPNVVENNDESSITRQSSVYRSNDARERYYAMKLLKNVTSEKLEDLEREAAIMSQLDHPNIVQFFGLSFKSGKLALLFEYMEQGDLVNYLRNHSPDTEDCQSPLEWSELMTIAVQISKGLEYLAEHHLVHRDLAARNCLVGKDMVVKISDFGMTRDIYITDYYKMGSRTLVPLRWLPPESILYRKFTVESDMWSFGVLLWEIFSYGKIPWYIHSNCEVLQIIQEGRLLDCPEGSPEEVYNYVMLKCWSKHPSERMSAKAARKKLEELIEARLRYCNILPSPCGSRPNSPDISKA